MSKLTLTAIGGAGVAAAVPMMHLGTPSKAVKVSSIALFLAGWVLVTGGLAMPSPGTKDVVTSKWKTRQLVLSVTGAGMVVAGAAMIMFRPREVPYTASAVVFVTGWALVTAAVVLSDADYDEMSPIEKTGRVVQSLLATLSILSGTMLITRGPPRAVQMAGIGSFVLGWAGLVATSAMQD